MTSATRRLIRIADFLTKPQIAAASRLWKQRTNTTAFRRDVIDEILIPNMNEINRKLGQPNLPDYLAYVLEYVFNEMDGK